MNATEEVTPTTAWHDRPLVELPCKLPQRTREHLVNQGIDTLGKLAEALDDGRDIGLSDLAERCRAAIEDLRAEDGDDEEEESESDEDTEGSAVHVPAGAGGDGAATETIGKSVNRIIDALPGTNGCHVQAGQLPDAAEARAKILEANSEVDEAERVYLVANERAKEAKKEFESAKANLRKVVTWSNTPIVPPKPDLFSGIENDRTKAPQNIPNAIPTPGVSREIEDCWRKFPLSRFEQFDLPEGVIKTLADQGISTVGELADFTKPNDNGYAKRLNDLKGIGPGKITKIEEATTAFWAWFPAHRDEFARELGLLNGNAPVTGTGSEGTGDGIEGDTSAATDEPEPKHAGSKRKRGKKK